MKYRLKKDLPFMKAGTFFKLRQGWAERFEKTNDAGISDVMAWAYGITESAFLLSILDNNDWVEAVPNDDPLTVKALIDLLKEMPQDFIVRCEAAIFSDTVTRVDIDKRNQGHVLITRQNF